MSIKIPKNWQESKLKNILSFLIDNRGKNPPRYYDSGIPVIDNFQITGKKSINIKKSKRFINKEVFDTFIRKYIQENDLLITLVGNGYGNVALAPKEKSVIIQNTIGVRCNDSCLNEFLFYTLTLNKRLIKNLDRGAAQPSIKVSDLLSIKLQLPSISIQQKITSILSAFDELIENNRRRIEILEETAQLLYREWFVEFRFPCHKKVKMINSELGKIPKGWKMQKIGDIAKYYRGISYRSDNLVESCGIPFLSLKSILVNGGYRENGLKEFAGNYKETHKVKKGDIIIAITEVSPAREIIARAGQVPTLPSNFGVFSMDLVKILPKNKNHLQFLYRLLRSYEYSELIKMYANGANVLHLSPEKIMSFEFLSPTPDLIEQHCDIDKKVFEMKDNLMRQNQVYIETRNLLLPKLMSGEIKV